MVCTNCGSNIPDGSKFCPKCGTKIEYDEKLTEQAAEPEDLQQSEDVEPTRKFETTKSAETGQQSKPDDPISEYLEKNLPADSDSKAERRISGKVIGIIVAAVIVVAAVAVVLILTLGGGGGEESDETANVTASEEKPSETLQSSETLQPTETTQPSETPEPTETTVPSETPEPTETTLPSETPQPSESGANGEISNTIDSGTCGEGLNWTLNNEGTLTISGAGTLIVHMGSDELPWYSYYDSITTIVIGKDVTSIDVQPVILWPADALGGIQVENGNSTYCSIDGVLFSADGTTLLAYPKAKAEGTYNIPEGTTRISYSSFIGCQSLTSIVVPGTVTNIEDSAFTDCSNLKEITFNGNAPAFGTENGALNNCFSRIVATAYYPESNPTWTTDIMQDYGGTITWKPY